MNYESLFNGAKDFKGLGNHWYSWIFFTIYLTGRHHICEAPLLIINCQFWKWYTSYGSHRRRFLFLSSIYERAHFAIALCIFFWILGAVRSVSTLDISAYLIFLRGSLFLYFVYFNQNFSPFKSAKLMYSLVHWLRPINQGLTSSTQGLW